MAAHFDGQVVGVLDGDTIEVLHEKKPERIRCMASIAQRRGSHSVRTLSKPPPLSSSVRT
jgi:hypothetical protein